ncbi:MAG: multidrug effflux MFS transporter, partial [Pseudomonadota bacterium]
FVPSMPSIAADLGTSYAAVQLGLSLYLAATAVIPLIAGPISDRYGRRPVLIVGLVVFLVGTVVCTYAETVTAFLAGRLLQTASAAGIVLSRAIVRDVYPREKSASMIGYIVMGMAIAPMIGPAIGGWADGQFGWQASFVIVGLFGFTTLVATAFFLPETNTNTGLTFADQLATWGELMRLPLFWMLTLTAASTSAVFFSFLGGGPSVSANHFGQTPFEYGAWFALCALGYAIGNFISGRFSERRGVERMFVDGATLTCLAPALSLALFSFGVDHPGALFLPTVLLGVGNGMALPNVTAATISIRPEAAGAASGLLGALQMGLGAVGSVIGGIIAGETGNPITVTGYMAAIGLASLIIALKTRTMCKNV